SLRAVNITEGNRVGIDPREVFSPECQREARADGNGIVSLAPLIWQGDLPGIETGKPMFVRDLGWEENRRIRSAFPLRAPYVLLIPAPGWDPEIREYEAGMRALWGDEVGGLGEGTGFSDSPRPEGARVGPAPGGIPRTNPPSDPGNLQ
ncbi:hypothetical protein ACFL3Z_02300, partial [Gemmatimonadota bacterium]